MGAGGNTAQARDMGNGWYIWAAQGGRYRAVGCPALDMLFI